MRLPILAQNVLLSLGQHGRFLLIPGYFSGPRILSADEYCAHSVGFLAPMKGNVHSITALEKDTVFFDLLIPGYKRRRPRYFVLDDADCMISGRVYWIRETLPSYTTGKWNYPQVALPLVEEIDVELNRDLHVTE